MNGRGVGKLCVVLAMAAASAAAVAGHGGWGGGGGGYYHGGGWGGGSYHGGGWGGGYHGYYHGYYHRGGYCCGASIGFYFGPGFAYGYPYPYYGYPYPYPYPYYPYGPAVDATAMPTQYIEQGQAGGGDAGGGTGAPQIGYWYHCARPEGYYPYVKACPGGWERVPAQPPGN